MPFSILHYFGVPWLHGGMMHISWQTVSDRLVSRWFDTGDPVRYSPPWMNEASKLLDSTRGAAPPVPLTKLSPFGVKHWYAPHHPPVK